LAFSASGGWASVVVGNPPWVAYRHMSTDLQKRFKELAKGERVYVGGKLATQNDLSALFTVRAAALYLRSSGKIAFVLPLAALSRGQFERLRSGSFMSARIAWDEVWTMDDSVQPLFPVPSCVVFGRRRATSKPLPDKVRAYSGTLPFRDAPEEIADLRLKVREGAPALDIANFEGGSPYRKMFRQGATLVPRVLCLVERRRMGRLGADPSAPYVASRRTNQEKEPWKSLPGIENRVEAEFLRPVLLGESILPYRVFKPFEGVVPVTDKGEVLDSEAAANRGFDGLHGWMNMAENPFSPAGSGAREISTKSCSTCRFHASTPTILCTMTSPRPREAEALAASVPLPENINFQRARPRPRRPDRGRHCAKDRRARGKAPRRRVSLHSRRVTAKTAYISAGAG
jgi:hypothetical protein